MNGDRTMNEVTVQNDLDRKVDLLLALSSTAKSDVKKALDRNFLKILVDANPSMDKKYFLDFIHKAQLTGADPRLNQIYLIPHKTKNYDTKEFEVKGTVMFNYMFYMQLATNTGQLEDWGSDVVEDAYLDIITGRKKPSWKAIAWVKRKGREKVYYECDFWEISKLDFNTGLPSGNWKSMPKFMVRKCAIAGAFRWAFPETLGNFYISEEMDKVIDVEISQPSVLVKKEAVAQKISKDVKKVVETEQLAQVGQIENTQIDADIEQSQESEEFKDQIPNENDPECDPMGYDFVGERDIEDMRGELMDTLESMGNEFFAGMKKTKAEILVQISLEKKIENMRKMYDFIIEKVAQIKPQ
jgi:phage recombination protein Bet